MPCAFCLEKEAIVSDGELGVRPRGFRKEKWEVVGDGDETEQTLHSVSVIHIPAIARSSSKPL
jgi:hypothetical protein